MSGGNIIKGTPVILAERGHTPQNIRMMPLTGKQPNAKGHIITYTYDDAGNLLKTEIQKNQSSPKEMTETNTYDYLGRLKTKRMATGIQPYWNTTAPTAKNGKTIGDTFGNAALAMIYDDKDYKIELSQNVETLKSIPGDMLNGIIDNVKTLVNLEKAYDFFINPEATLANNVEYMSAGISTGMTVYGGAKSLQSGHQFLKGIHINTGNMSAGMSGFSASAAMSSGISSVEAGVTASVKAIQMGMPYASTGFSGIEGTRSTQWVDEEEI